jgi:hypothetical protein
MGEAEKPKTKLNLAEEVVTIDTKEYVDKFTLQKKFIDFIIQTKPQEKKGSVVICEIEPLSKIVTVETCCQISNDIKKPIFRTGKLRYRITPELHKAICELVDESIFRNPHDLKHLILTKFEERRNEAAILARVDQINSCGYVFVANLKPETIIFFYN